MEFSTEYVDYGRILEQRRKEAQNIHLANRVRKLPTRDKAVR